MTNFENNQACPAMNWIQEAHRKAPRIFGRVGHAQTRPLQDPALLRPSPAARISIDGEQREARREIYPRWFVFFGLGSDLLTVQSWALSVFV